MADIKIEDIGFASCEPTGALVNKVYYAPIDYFEEIPTPKDLCGDSANAAKTLDELATIATPFKFKTGKGFHPITTVTETGEVTSTQIGERNRRLFENTLPVTVGGSSAKILGFARYIKNQNLIVLFQEYDSGNMRVLGSQRMPAWCEAQEHKIEATAEGNNSLVTTFKDKSKYPAPIYTGDIVMFPDAP
ncbi:hypothetical protein [Myroides sp.]|uniref:hypothetical protein n=1 Tax=Myroides sp. TaxID=1874736 RepID=UPI003F32F770